MKSTVFEISILVGCDATHDDERFVRYRNTAALHGIKLTRFEISIFLDMMPRPTRKKTPTESLWEIKNMFKSTIFI